MGASFSVAAASATALLADSLALLGTETAAPPVARLVSPAPVRRVGGAAVAPVADRVGLGTALPEALRPLVGAAFAATFVACVAPVAASDAFVLLVVTAVILAL